MIKSVKIINYLGDELVLELTRPEKSGFAIMAIDGISAEKADISISDLTGTDGGRFNSARRGPRNITLSLKFLENPSIEHARHLSYKYFPVKSKITLIFTTDERVCSITGYVESNEAAIFNSSEGCDISILCPDPSFFSAGADSTNVTEFSGIEALFEFPFANESLSVSLLEFGSIHHSTRQSIVYTGDSEVGMTINIHILGPVKKITIYAITSGGKIVINTDRVESITGSALSVGDDIIINSEKGKKSIVLVRSGVRYNILNSLDRGTDWFYLKKGDNVFAYTADEGEENLQFRIENKIIYEGV